MSLWDYIDERFQELMETELRPGFYVATASNALQSLRRMAIDAEWGPTLEQARRISSPILDVIPAVGTRLAVISQDGVPEFPAILGKVWDDAGTADSMTAWLRANLQEHAGHLELGATKGLRIKVGQNDAAITETNDGEIVVESEDGGQTITLKPNGDVVVDVPAGNQIELAGSSKHVALAEDVEDELEAIRDRLWSHTHQSTSKFVEDPQNGTVVQTQGPTAGSPSAPGSVKSQQVKSS